MKKWLWLSLGMLPLAGSASPWLPDAAANSGIAFPGYSGYFYVPSATVVPHGQLNTGFSNSAWFGGRYTDTRNAHFNVGVFPHVELGARLAWVETRSNCFDDCGGPRDLSGHIKFQIPWIPDDLFDLAVGLQDPGGAANQFESRYIVAGRNFGPLSTSVGYGQTLDRVARNPRYLDGAFAAASLAVTSWLSAIVEYDGDNTNIGAALATPADWSRSGIQFGVRALATSSSDQDAASNAFAATVTVPLGRQRVSYADEVLDDWSDAQEDQAAGEEGAGVIAIPVSEDMDVGESEDNLSPEPTSDHQALLAQHIGARLSAERFDRVRVAIDGDHATLVFENSEFVVDFRDAQFAALSAVLPALGGSITTLTFVTTRLGVPVLESEWRVVDGAPVRLSQNVVPSQFAWRNTEWLYKGGHGPLWKPRVQLTPLVVSFVGTELGVFDSSYGLQSDLTLNLWPGGRVLARHVAELYSDSNFDDGQPFARQRIPSSQIATYQFSQSVALPGRTLLTGHTMRMSDDFFLGADAHIVELDTLSPNGRHMAGVNAGQVDIDTVLGVFNRFRVKERFRQTVFQYGYYNPRLNTDTRIFVGRFLQNDRGYSVQQRFYFNDTAIQLTYRNTDDEFVSIGFSVPLTPRRAYNFEYGQIYGTPDFTYAVQTRIREDRNTVSSNTGQLIRPVGGSQRDVLLNRGRMGY